MHLLCRFSCSISQVPTSDARLPPTGCSSMTLSDRKLRPFSDLRFSFHPSFARFQARSRLCGATSEKHFSAVTVFVSLLRRVGAASKLL